MRYKCQSLSDLESFFCSVVSSVSRSFFSSLLVYICVFYDDSQDLLIQMTIAKQTYKRIEKSIYIWIHNQLTMSIWHSSFDFHNIFCLSIILFIFQQNFEFFLYFKHTSCNNGKFFDIPCHSVKKLMRKCCNAQTSPI